MKPKLLKRRKRVYESVSSRQKSRKSLTLRLLWNLAKPVKNYHGIIVHQRLTVLRRVVLPRERYAELKKGLLQYCCNLAWTKVVGRFHEMLLLSAKCSRPLIRWKNTFLMAIRRTIQRTSNSVWFDDRISSYSCERPVKTPPPI